MIVSVVDVATNAAPDDDRLLRRGGEGTLLLDEQANAGIHKASEGAGRCGHGR